MRTLYRVGQKTGPPVKKLTDFSIFWYTESRRNVTSDDYKFIHHTYKSVSYTHLTLPTIYSV